MRTKNSSSSRGSQSGNTNRDSQGRFTSSNSSNSSQRGSQSHSGRGASASHEQRDSDGRFKSSSNSKK